MALFLQLYYDIPATDLKKTTLADGNPHRFDHILLGGTMVRASLYKPPKTVDMIQFWLWDDPEFDSLDTQPSERMVSKSIYDTIAQEMERVRSDKKIAFPAHYIIGNQLQRQLGFLYSKGIEFQVAENETLFHVILGATSIELSLLATAKWTDGKTLKPQYLNNWARKHNMTEFTPQKRITETFQHENFTLVEKFAKSDMQNLHDLYYILNES